MKTISEAYSLLRGKACLFIGVARTVFDVMALDRHGRCCWHNRQRKLVAQADRIGQNPEIPVGARRKSVFRG